MVWRIEFDERAERQLEKLDRIQARRIERFFYERVAHGDPRKLGMAMEGDRFGDLYRFRIGDYRAIAELQDDLLIVVVVKVGHRKDVYR